MYALLMGPSNAICDRLGLTDEHERGMMRMLVNMLLITALCMPFIYLGWRIVSRA